MDTKRIIFVGVGGQGNLLASRLLGEAAVASGIPIKVAEVHGMAQRGGVVESSAVLGQAISPIVSDGEADIIVGFEPVETLRSLAKANANTLVITSTAKLPPLTVALGQADYPETEDVLKLIGAKVKKVIAFDAMAEATKASNPLGVNIVLLGALAAVGNLPVKEKALMAALEAGTKKQFLGANKMCFELGAAAAKAAI